MIRQVLRWKPRNAGTLGRLASWLPKMARLFVASVALSALFMFLLMRDVRARVNDMTVRFGDELAKLPSEQTLNGAIDGDFYRVLLNGASAQISTGVTSSDVGEVLGRAFTDCSDHADGMVEDFKDLDHAIQPNAVRKQTGAPGFAGVKEQIDDDQGFVACFANGRELSRPEAWAKLQETLDTGDVSRIGHLRYVHAKKQPDGNTFVYAVWTDGPFNLKTMFPEQGDAPGSDPAGIARPEGSRRILTSTVEGAPAAVRIYEVPLAPEDAMQFYASAFSKAGFPAAVTSDAAHVGRIFATGETAFMVQAVRAAEGRSTVSVTESRFRKSRTSAEPR